MEHIHTRSFFILDLVFRKLLTMSAVKTDVNPSDIGTKTLGRQRFCTMRATLGLGCAMSLLTLVHLETGTMYHWLKWTTRRVASPRYAQHTCRVIDKVRKWSRRFLFPSGSRDASRADKSPHESRRRFRLQRDFVQCSSDIRSTCTSVFTHG